MTKTYGVPYKGSKNGIAKQLITFLPLAENFYDLFAGGCAMTHAAMISNKYRRVIANDIDSAPMQLFRDAINGKYHDEKRWISREEFERHKDSDPYVRYCWSFGNNGTHYLYAPDREQCKKLLHSMVFAKTRGEKKALWLAFMTEFQKIENDISESTAKRNRLKRELSVSLAAEEIRRYLRAALEASGKTQADVNRLLGTKGMAGHYFNASQWQLPSAAVYEKMKAIIPDLNTPYGEMCEKYITLRGGERQGSSLTKLNTMGRLEAVQKLDHLTRLRRLQRLEKLKKRLDMLEMTSCDYSEVEIKPHSIIYCDIPYRGTDAYQKESFDHERFYNWAAIQRTPVFISEYTLPDKRFECVLEIAKRGTYSATANNAVTERIFRPKIQLLKEKAKSERFSK